MKNKFIAYGVIGALVVAGTVFFIANNMGKPSSGVSVNEEQEVRKVVLEFGQRMKNVSLLSPNVVNEMRAQYTGLVSEDILAFWEADTTRAAGRRTSSPWPERIDILEVTKDDDGSYDVQGVVIEVTSMEVASGGAASQYSIALRVRYRDGAWIITGYQAITPAL